MTITVKARHPALGAEIHGVDMYQPLDTATVAVILTIFAIWATIAQAGPFAQMGLNESFLLLLTFMLAHVDAFRIRPCQAHDFRAYQPIVEHHVAFFDDAHSFDRQ